MGKRADENRHDKTVQDSFPASDPPANSGITGPECDKHPGSRESQQRNERIDRASG